MPPLNTCSTTKVFISWVWISYWYYNWGCTTNTKEASKLKHIIVFQCSLFSAPFILHALQLCALCTLLWLVSTAQHPTHLCLSYFSPVLHSCSPSGMRLSHSLIPNHQKLCAYSINKIYFTFLYWIQKYPAFPVVSHMWMNYFDLWSENISKKQNFTAHSQHPLRSTYWTFSFQF